MEWVAKLLNECPAAGKYAPALEGMQEENRRLRAENAALREELAQFIQNWETLDWDAVRTLQYLSERETAHAAEIAEGYRLNLTMVECSLAFLERHEYVHAPAADGQLRYRLARKGERYLRARGLDRG